MKQLQYTSKTSEILETYIYNIGEGECLCLSIPFVGVGADDEWRRASTSATSTGFGLVGRVARATGGARAPPPPAHATGRVQAVADGAHGNSEGSARPRLGQCSRKAVRHRRRKRKG
jgi:hypothetical protein